MHWFASMGRGPIQTSSYAHGGCHLGLYGVSPIDNVTSEFSVSENRYTTMHAMCIRQSSIQHTMHSGAASCVFFHLLSQLYLSFDFGNMHHKQTYTIINHLWFNIVVTSRLKWWIWQGQNWMKIEENAVFEMLPPKLITSNLIKFIYDGNQPIQS